MKTVTKLVRFKAIEIDEIQCFLNRNAAEGWHPIRFNTFLIRLAYLPENHHRYTLIHRSLSAGFSAYHQQSDRQQEFLEDFSYDKIFTNSLFYVYASDIQEDFYTDEFLSDELRAKIANKIFPTLFLTLVVFLLQLYTFRFLSINFFLSNISQLAFSLLTGIIIQNLYDILRTYQYKKGIRTKSLFKWNKRTTDPLTLTTYALIILLISFFFTSSLDLRTFIAYFVLMIIFYLSHRIIESQNITRLKKGVIFFSIVVISSLSFLRFQLNYSFDRALTNTSPNVYVRESWLAKEIDYTDNSKELVIKHNIFTDMMFEAFYKSHYIDGTFENNTLTKTMTYHGYTRYVYQTPQRIVISDIPLDNSFYQE